MVDSICLYLLQPRHLERRSTGIAMDFKSTYFFLQKAAERFNPTSEFLDPFALPLNPFHFLAKVLLLLC